MVRCAISTSRRRSQRRSGQSSPTATISSRSLQAALGQRPRWIFSAPTIRRRTGHRRPATTSTLTDLVEAHALLLDYLRAGGARHHLQLWLRSRLLGSAGDRHGQTSVGRRFQVNESLVAPAIRGDRRQSRQGARAARLQPEHADLERSSARPMRGRNTCRPKSLGSFSSELACC